MAKAYGTDDQDAAADARTRLRHALLGDDVLAGRLVPFHALIRDDLRGFPYVVPAQGLVMTESPQRANTGTHYTPRSLAEEVVLHALEPLVYSPGPLDTENSDEWVLKSSAEILDLKVADIAAGSGAFLVAAARYLADRLIEARSKEGLDVGAESDIQRWAVREIVARCLYGADINGMAVEMCKLSLWLISMDPGKPFSFVDDRVFHGNSLLGVTTESQLKAQHIHPENRANKTPLRWFDVDKDLEDAARLRRELGSGQVDDADRMRSTRAKRALLAQAEEVTAKLRDVADGIIAAGLIDGGKPGRKLEDRYDDLADALRDAYPSDNSQADRRRLDSLIDTGLTPTVETGDARWRPLHWILSAPDAFQQNGGFDAVIGNPPFLGGQKISGSMGPNFRDWLVEVIGRGKSGSSDLVGYFLLRAADSTAANGHIGLIATNSVAQGVTREVGLEQLLEEGFGVYRAVQSKQWPARSAVLEYAAIWSSRRRLAPGVGAISDGVRVPKISALLEPEGRVSGAPKPLKENAGIAFLGVITRGTGFIVDKSEAEWLRSDGVSATRYIRPYLGGEDLVTNPDFSASRLVVDFGGLSAVEAALSAPLAWDHLREHVKPGREALDRTRYGRLVERWWEFEARRPGLYAALSGLSSAIAIARVSKVVMPAVVPSNQVFSDAVFVFASDSQALLATLSSSVHNVWAITYSSTLETRVRYTATDVFETFPLPQETLTTRNLGEALDQTRRETMLRRGIGLTALYNLVNSPVVIGDNDIDGLRSIHVQIDEAVLDAYGWSDIALGHGFHTYRQMERWTVSPAARVEILDRLLEENHRRAAVEAQAVPTKVKRGKSLAESEQPEGAMF